MKEETHESTSAGQLIRNDNATSHFPKFLFNIAIVFDNYCYNNIL